MPFTVDVDFYYDVLHQIGCPPHPGKSREFEQHIQCHIDSFPQEQAERWWRAWYCARVERPDLASQRAIMEDKEESANVDRWLAVVRAACHLAEALVQKTQTWPHALPFVDLWLGWRASPDSPRFVASLGAGWEPGPPRLRGEPDR